jgi:hypothetical protein
LKEKEKENQQASGEKPSQEMKQLLTKITPTSEIPEEIIVAFWELLESEIDLVFLTDEEGSEVLKGSLDAKNFILQKKPEKSKIILVLQVNPSFSLVVIDHYQSNAFKYEPKEGKTSVISQDLLKLFNIYEYSDSILKNYDHLLERFHQFKGVDAG